jgi:ribosomal 50S subunit-recycling heat shock protein
MRIDKFLNSVNITKNRAQSQDMINSKVIYINDKMIKASSSVRVGDTIKIEYLESEKSFKVIEIPTTNSTKKDEQQRYVEIIS